MGLLWGLRGTEHLSINPSLKYAELIRNYFIFYFMRFIIGPQNTYSSLVQGGRLSWQSVVDVVKPPEGWRSLA